jgi:hypothetical protein
MVQEIKKEVLSNQNRKEKSNLKARPLSHIATKGHRRALDPIFLPAFSSKSSWLETNKDYAMGATKNKIEATVSLLRAVRTFR